MENKYTLVSAKWCPNCGPTKKQLDLMNVEYTTVDADSVLGMEICSQYSVRGLPSLITEGRVITGQDSILKYFKEM